MSRLYLSADQAYRKITMSLEKIAAEKQGGTYEVKTVWNQDEAWRRAAVAVSKIANASDSSYEIVELSKKNPMSGDEALRIIAEGLSVISGIDSVLNATGVPITDFKMYEYATGPQSEVTNASTYSAYNPLIIGNKTPENTTETEITAWLTKDGAEYTGTRFTVSASPDSYGDASTWDGMWGEDKTGFFGYVTVERTSGSTRETGVVCHIKVGSVEKTFTIED